MTLASRARFTARTLCVALAAVCGAANLAPASAQVSRQAPPANPRLDSLRRLYRVPPAPVRPIVVATFLGAPGSSLGSPSVSGVGMGDYFVGAGYQERTRFSDRPDGGVGIGVGFGDPEAGVGLETTLSSYSSIRHSFASIGGFSFKLHHRDPQHLMLYAAGVENAVSWGGSDAGTSVYGMLGHVFVLRPGDNANFGVVSASLGVGNGRFRSQSAVQNHRSTVGVFGGLGLRILPSVALAADWTGQDLDAGFTITPFPNRGIVGSIGFADLTHSAGNGARFIMSIGYGFNARRDDRRLSPEDLNAVFKSP